MDRIDKYKMVEEDQQQDKGKGKVIPQERRDIRSDRYNQNRPQRDFAGQPGPTAPQVVNTVFREPMHQFLEKIKNKTLQMTEQDEWRPLEVQSEPSLPIPPGAGAYHRGLQNSVKQSETTAQRGMVTAVFVLA